MTQIEQFLQLIRHIWRDSRVPLLARIYVVLAPLYWINPFDLIPDLQPTGHCDDVIIFCLLVVMALRLVPAAVFYDSRKAALLGRKAATFGMLYVTVAGSIPWQGHTLHTPETSPAQILGSAILKDCSISAQSNELSAQVKTKAHSHDHQHCRTGKFSASPYPSASCVLTILMPMIVRSCHLFVDKYGALALMITRGGQYQLYASEDASAHILAENSQCLFHTPPQLAGGVFITQLLSDEDSCVPKS